MKVFIERVFDEGETMGGIRVKREIKKAAMPAPSIALYLGEHSFVFTKQDAMILRDCLIAMCQDG